MRCTAFSCDDPESLQEEDAVDLQGEPAHPDCARYELSRLPCEPFRRAA